MERYHARAASSAERLARVEEKMDSEEELEGKVRRLVAMLQSAQHAVVYTGGVCVCVCVCVRALRLALL